MQTCRSEALGGTAWYLATRPGSVWGSRGREFKSRRPDRITAGHRLVERRPSLVSAVRVGVEVRHASDCTSGGLLWIDAIACMEKLHGRLNASDLQSVALYGTSGALLANNNVGVYENYRDGSGPTKICASTPDVRVGSGSNAVVRGGARGVQRHALLRLPGIRRRLPAQSSDSPARYRRI